MPLTAAVDNLRGQVDELIVLHLQDTLLLSAVGQVGVVPVHFWPLSVSVVVEVEILHCVLLSVANQYFCMNSFLISHLRILDVVFKFPVKREKTEAGDEIPILS